MSQDSTPQEPESESEGAVVLPLPWGSFLSEQLYKWRRGEIDCGCREMAIRVRQIVEEEIAKGSIRGKNAKSAATGISLPVAAATTCSAFSCDGNGWVRCETYGWKPCQCTYDGKSAQDVANAAAQKWEPMIANQSPEFIRNLRFAYAAGYLSGASRPLPNA